MSHRPRWQAVLFAALSALLSIPAHASEVRTPPFDVDAVIRQVSPASAVGSGMIVDGRLTAADTDRREHSALAFNGTDYLVVWRYPRGRVYDVYAARVSGSGTVLDPAGLALGTGPGIGASPAVASNGTDFFVVWTQNAWQRWELRGTRVTAAGEVSSPGGMRVSTTALRSQYWPAIASNGTDYLLVWHQFTADGFSDILGRRISSTGALLDPSDLLIAGEWEVFEEDPSVASNGTVYLVAWNQGTDDDLSHRVHATRVSTEGEVLEGTGFPLRPSDSYQLDVQLASNGTNFLAAWVEVYGLDEVVYMARVTEWGDLPDPLGFAVNSSSSPQNHERYPALASDGTGYLLAWCSVDESFTGHVRATRISASAPAWQAVHDPGGFVLSAYGTVMGTAVAPADHGYFVAWERNPDQIGDLDFAWVSPAASVAPGSYAVTASVSSLHQTEPSVASNGSNHLVVWTETSPDGIKIYGTRLTLDGGAIDVPPLEIAVSNRERGAPAVASNGTDYFVAWADFRDMNWNIYGARVLGSGLSSAAVVDADGIAVSTHPAFQGNPAVASDGTDYLVVWRQDAGGGGDIHGARVTGSGTVLDPGGIEIAAQGIEHYTPRVASNGSGYFVVWAEYRDLTGWDVQGARVSAAGALLDPAGIGISNAVREQYDPDIAADGIDYFVAWSDHRSGSDNDIYGARVSGSGAVLDAAGLALGTLPLHQYRPRVSHDGTGYLAAWTDYGSSQPAIRATRVTSSGTVATPGGFQAVSNLPPGEPSLALVSNGDGQHLLVHSRYDEAPAQGSRRIRGSFVSF